jgi:DHA1 family bicyclomycin/chloramphenicol resistance-like MFS transporter
MQRNNVLIALSLGTLCAIGPLGTDTYLGAMPEMASTLKATAATIQLSVMTFFAGFTIGQLFYGPISDRTGRKPMIYVALAIFFVASLGCLYSNSGSTLLAWRFLQGLGGSIGMVIATAIVRDLYTGVAAAKLMSMVVLVLGIAPIVAPLLGSLILQLGTWHTIFAVLAGFAALCAAVVYLWLPETRMVELRAESRPNRAVIWYAHLLKSRHFIPFAGTLALVQGGFFAYIAGSSFVLIDIYGLSPLVFSIVFGLNAIGLTIGAQLGTRQIRRFGPKAVVRAAVLVYAAAGLLLVATQLAGVANLWTTCVLLFVLIASLGGIMPSCNVLAMEAHGAIAGTAAALVGALGFGAGALASFLLGLLDNGTPMPMIAIIALCGVLATLVSQLAFGDAAPVVTEAIEGV